VGRYYYLEVNNGMLNTYYAQCCDEGKRGSPRP
jgi:hypothetical protein